MIDAELPVLSRWFRSADIKAPRAKWLDIILYSRDQIKQEDADMGRASEGDDNYEWGIVGVKGQIVDHELPMSPITMVGGGCERQKAARQRSHGCVADAQCCRSGSRRIRCAAQSGRVHEERCLLAQSRNYSVKCGKLLKSENPDLSVRRR